MNNYGRNKEQTSALTVIKHAVPYFIIPLFVMLALGFTSKSDMLQAKLEKQNYCSMVQSGIWPNYKAITNIKDYCK